VKVAFYYHIGGVRFESSIRVPSFLGVFLDALAEQTEQLSLLFHQAKRDEQVHCDYLLRASNITPINLGQKTPAWHRELFHGSVIRKMLKRIEDADALLVRAPSPLAAYFHKYLSKPKLWFMIVGDYLEGTDHYVQGSFRDKMIYCYLRYNDIFFQRQIRKTPVLVNSPALYDKYVSRAPATYLIRTTTLSEADLFERSDTCTGNTLNLLYSGVLSPAKGLFELLDALKILVDQSMDVHLHLVGWEDDAKKPVEMALREKAKKLRVENRLTIHGKKSVGPELNAMYRMADIFVLPSHAEGFPRVIWEAMANSLPVVASTVGGIPGMLEHQKHAVLIRPKDSSEIAQAVKRVNNDSALRKTLIKGGFELAKGNTLSKQTKNLIDILRNNRH
jgi:glycosyltransferase involved in cell wall biosynthesis